MEQLHSLETQPPLLFERAAQNIYNQPHDALGLAHELHSTLIKHYSKTGMSDHLPDKARYLELRGPWNALLAPIVHGIEIEISKTVLPFAGKQLAPPVVINRPHLDQSFSQEYVGAELFTMRAISQWTLQAAEWFLEDAGTVSGHWARPIVDAFSEYHTSFRKAESLQKDGWSRCSNPIDVILKVVLDSNETAFAVINPLINHYAQSDPEWDAKPKTEHLLTKTEELSWAASVTGQYLGDYLGRAGQPSKGNPFALPCLVKKPCGHFHL